MWIGVGRVCRKRVLEVKHRRQPAKRYDTNAEECGKTA